MTTFRSFEEMEVWQESRKTVKAVRAICRRPAVKRDFAFIDQITRSARSISANIAEGFDAMTVPEFIQFLGHAKRSAGEVRSHYYDALDEKYVSPEEFLRLSAQVKSVGKMIAGFIHYLQSLDQKRKRTRKSQIKNQQIKNQ